MPEHVRVNDHPGEVLRALKAIRQAPDTRAMKRELQAGNHYVTAFLAARGLVYDGAIHAKETHG